jgi:hypothetical protein
VDTTGRHGARLRAALLAIGPGSRGLTSPRVAFNLGASPETTRQDLSFGKETQMHHRTHVIAASVLVGLLLVGCQTEQVQTRDLELTAADVQLDWGITIFQEEPCSGNRMAGGEISGTTTFAGIGPLAVNMTSAWDIGNLLAEADKRYQPVSPVAAGPAAPVLGVNDYPHAFQFDPFQNACLGPGESVVSATGEVVFTAAGGDELYGRVTGGETHRLDFVLEGDGIETFAEIEFVGGTGRFDGATGSFVVHTIFRFDFATEAFVLELVEVLPGGTVRY